jgi:hypothetical protein
MPVEEHQPGKEERTGYDVFIAEEGGYRKSLLRFHALLFKDPGTGRAGTRKNLY